jgi:energy-coupling factor transporter ATP-binding protein EcfA2
LFWVSYVKSTLKGGCDVLLAPKTVLCGANGSGKSTIVQAIELALTGQVTDMEGRKSVRQSSALARLFTDGEPMYSEVVLTDGKSDHVFRWEMEKKKDGYKTPEHQVPFSVRFPVQDMETILQGDAKTVGAWLESRVNPKMSVDDVLTYVSPSFRDQAETYMKRHGKTDLIQLAKLCAEEAKNLKSGATKSRKAADQMTEGIAPPLIASKLKLLQDEKAQLLTVRLNVGNTTAEEKAQLVSRLTQVDAALSELGKVVLPKVDGTTEKLLRSLAAIKGMMHVHVTEFGMKECKICSNTDSTAIGKQVQKLEVAEKTVKAKAEALATVMAHQEKITKLTHLKDSLQDSLSRAVVGGINVEAETRIQAIDKLLNSDTIARKSWANASRVQAEANQEEAEANLLSLLGKEFKRVGDALMQANKSGFETRIKGFLPQGEELVIDLDNTRIGLLRNNRIHSALSGAEENRVLLALCAAQEDGSTPSIMIPKDRAWDPVTLERMMIATVSAPVQIVVMSTVAPHGSVDGWEIHLCGK